MGFYYSLNVVDLEKTLKKGCCNYKNHLKWALKATM